MSRARGAQRGLTLIELIIYIVVVLVGLAGVLTVFNTTVRGSADPGVRNQALALAGRLLGEALAPDEFLTELENECRLKPGAAKQAMGFLH